jgi:hypothetical protein
LPSSKIKNSSAKHVNFMSVGKLPHNCQTLPTQLTRRDTSLTFLPTTPEISAHNTNQ